jgi:hypothetical protein
MSILQNFPDEGPSLNLNFASSRTLDSRITFTRTSTGTYTDKNGLVAVAPANTPRFDHSYDGSNVQSLGLLIEESRTNLITYSQNVSLWTSSGSNTVNTSATTSPTGEINGNQITNNSNSNNYNFAYQNYTTSTKGAYTFSLFVKDNDISTISIIVGTDAFAANYARATYTFSTQSFSSYQYVGTPTGYVSSSTSTSYSNGWYKLSITFDTTSFASQTSLSVGIYSGVYGSTAASYTKSFYVWGAQLEAGAFPTSYIPTVASSVTRSADNASMTGINFSSWYNPSEGSLFAAARINALGGPGYPGIAYVDDGTTANCMGFYISDAGDDKIGAEGYVSGVNQYSLGSVSATVVNQLYRVISTYKVNDFAAAFSMGGTVGTDTSGSVPTVDRLRIGALRGGLFPLNGTISQLSYYPKRLTNSQLQNLTK